MLENAFQCERLSWPCISKSPRCKFGEPLALLKLEMAVKKPYLNRISHSAEIVPLSGCLFAIKAANFFFSRFTRLGISRSTNQKLPLNNWNRLKFEISRFRSADSQEDKKGVS